MHNLQFRSSFNIITVYKRIFIIAVVFIVYMHYTHTRISCSNMETLHVFIKNLVC